jgi:diguanylate cyclase (GGDEF)-like protein
MPRDHEADTGDVGHEATATRGIGTVRQWLPRGGLLPHDEWQRRHRALVGVLWVSTLALLLYGPLIGGYDLAHTLAHAGALLLLASLASSKQLNETIRMICASFGLLTVAALFVHVTGGVIEAHFLFFVVIVALTLYEAWTPFLLAAGYVLVHHGVLGTAMPEEVYSHSDAWSDPWRWALIHAFFVALAGTAGVVAWRLNENVRERMRLIQQELEELARTDELTGLPNRRWLYDELRREFARAARQGFPIRAAVVDLDRFKVFNDKFGHAAGDALLRDAADQWRSVLRVSDFLARTGGEEFVVLLPACEADEAEEVIERLRAATPLGQTCSAGIARWDELEGAEDLINRADQALYEAKKRGRDRIVSVDVTPPLQPAF